MTAFTTANLSVRHATNADRSALAAFCAANPGYDILLTGHLPNTDEWVEDFLTDLPPADFGWTATHKLLAFEAGSSAEILAIMDVSENMLAPGVGHIGLFQVAEAHQGTGLADQLYQGLESWLAGRGMDAFRLGVLQANPRGQRFWARHGYVRSRTRVSPDDPGQLIDVLRKSLRQESIDGWHKRVPRDCPQSP
jgi:GNAT superfamily N-acetyltransferase